MLCVLSAELVGLLIWGTTTLAVISDSEVRPTFRNSSATASCFVSVDTVQRNSIFVALSISTKAFRDGRLIGQRSGARPWTA